MSMDRETSCRLRPSCSRISYTQPLPPTGRGLRDTTPTRAATLTGSAMGFRPPSPSSLVTRPVECMLLSRDSCSTTVRPDPPITCVAPLEVTGLQRETLLVDRRSRTRDLVFAPATSGNSRTSWVAGARSISADTWVRRRKPCRSGSSTHRPAFPVSQ